MTKHSLAPSSESDSYGGKSDSSFQDNELGLKRYLASSAAAATRCLTQRSQKFHGLRIDSKLEINQLID
ncbi:hypothetical protein NHF56_04995 [Rhizobium sp. L1K21]|nr:hypothetical protein [Rhizobium sp. L1K21]